MKKLLLSSLLFLSCLATLPATAQAVVKLLPGDCLDRPFIGVDTTTWHRTLDYIAAAKKRIAAGQTHINNLTRELATATAGKNALQAELGRCRTEGEAKELTIAQLGAQAQKLGSLPIQPPLLADPRTYRVGGLALVAGLVAGVFLLH